VSSWTYVKGAVEVSVPGRTQAQIRYVLESVLDHLPRVTGSEGDMNVYISREAGHNCSMPCDEFGLETNNLRDLYGNKTRERGWLETQGMYMLTVEGNLRDREFEETKREFSRWLCRLAKRLNVYSVVVKIWGYGKSLVISDATPFDEMFEWRDGEKGWTDYLFWERDPRSDWPVLLADKYFGDEHIDEELKRRRQWHEKCEHDDGNVNRFVEKGKAAE